jgi:2-phospho-L-lactate guanylyltransferase
MPDMTDRGDQWSLIVPVKRLEVAKTRLAVDVEARADLAVAMAYDTVTVALSCDRVGEVLVVTDDPRAHHALEGVGARVIPDQPDAGLNAALRHGAVNAACGFVASLSSDLPALRCDDLSAVLDAAKAHRKAVVADLPGTGTTVYAASAAAEFAPDFGPDSHARHLRGGAADLTAVAGESVRRDVDTIDALRSAIALGVGPATEKALASMEI